MKIMFVNKKTYRALCKEFKITPIEAVEKGIASLNLDIGYMVRLTVKPKIKTVKCLDIPDYDFSKPLPVEFKPEEPDYWKPWML